MQYALSCISRDMSRASWVEKRDENRSREEHELGVFVRQRLEDRSAKENYKYSFIDEDAANRIVSDRVVAWSYTVVPSSDPYTVCVKTRRGEIGRFEINGGRVRFVPYTGMQSNKGQEMPADKEKNSLERFLKERLRDHDSAKTKKMKLVDVDHSAEEVARLLRKIDAGTEPEVDFSTDYEIHVNVLQNGALAGYFRLIEDENDSSTVYLNFIKSGGTTGTLFVCCRCWKSLGASYV